MATKTTEKVTSSALLQKLGFNPRTFGVARNVFRTLDHKLRLGMLEFLAKNGKKNVTEIFIEFRLEQSVASQHLAQLRRAELVNTERDGKHIYYFVNHDRLDQAKAAADELMKTIK